ncbi:hypothetical protein KJC18_11730 [Mammaliicoccus sciuri]|uniref:TrlF family AAA-like ATPase n=1 Tax=Mammaliicoccus sciuri TaxID=1296 RepID=UPI001F2100CA|nr:PHP-associated domain-containing protein [Mammaliicoccus sciuri]MDW4320429.1 PHP-associated domain-containing protein [Staphylococcus saprophyticus]HDH6132233.1 hypothetical protein [Staphylococcus aureus]MCE4981405.1 hypothetical protein [Mammaliicoccus sciuri]MCE5086310.1 hypothetical protein [Mammaliicoccus sciuri]MCE5095798.1 hypothetical protein [Mammaliicoccus sciuri]
MKFTGAKWWKVDFHTHTPASNDYRERITPREWLLEYMRKDIDCVVITDHNTGAWIDSLKEELKKMEDEGIEAYKQMYLFPGVEISITHGIHLLAILDLDKKSDDITSLLGKLGYNGTRGHSDGVAEKDINEAINIIHKEGGIAVPAHVDKTKGLFKSSEGITLGNTLKNENLLAIELCDTNYQRPQQYIEQERKIAEIVGSDSHHRDSIGSVYTWVKMEEPDLNAMKLSLHDCNDGVTRIENYENNPNDIQKRSYIKSIKITKGFKVGRGDPLIINFSPWMNSIIGGRGSGKSSIIEFMRLPFNQVNNLPPKVNEQFSNFRKIPSSRGNLGMLTEDSEIAVTMYKDGRDIELTWKNNKIIEKKDNIENVWETLEDLKSIADRFPVRIFSQKHLYELTEDPKFIINIIDEQWDKKKWEENNQNLIQEWLDNRARTRNLKKQLDSKGNLDALLGDLQAKIDIYEKSEHQKVLNDYQSYQSVNNKIENDVKDLKNYYDNLLSIYNGSKEKLYTDTIYHKMDDTSKEALSEQNKLFKTVQGNLKENLKQLKDLTQKIDEEIKTLPWTLQKNKNSKDYSSIISKLEITNTGATSYEELVEEKMDIENKLEKSKEVDKSYEELQTQGATILENIENHQKLLRTQRQRVINNWIGENENIRMYIEEMKNYEEAENDFRRLIRREGKTTYARDILDMEEERGFIYDLINATDVWTERKDIVNRLNKISEDNEQGFGKVFYNHLLDIKNKTPEDLDRIMIWYPEDKIVLKMVNSNKKEEDIATGSAGQRTAAMLSLMVRLDNSPIIIDQPEEDLDTRRITDLVVEDFKELKKKQQIITITHNPNIPVNGASENIIQMNFAGGQINKNVEGALQKEDVRKSVCEIMEGGKDALDKRYYRVSKALGYKY